MPDPWKTLDLSPDASAAETKAAYLSAAKAAHPDSHGGSSAAFLRVKDAFEQIASGAARRPTAPGDWDALRKRASAAKSQAPRAGRGAATGFRRGAADFHADARARRAGRSQGGAVGRFGAGLFLAAVCGSLVFTFFDIVRGFPRAREEEVVVRAVGGDRYGKGRRRRRRRYGEGEGERAGGGEGRAGSA